MKRRSQLGVRLIAALSVCALLAPALAYAERPPPSWRRSAGRYQVPDVSLVRFDGAKVDLRRELDDGKPVLVSFIFTTCAAVCPVMTRTIAEVQGRLGAERDRVHLVSISIDPEQDTPARLRDYAAHLNAGPEWTFYTGTVEATVLVQRAFDLYRGDKMNHAPVLFLRAAPGERWLRLEGFGAADDVARELKRMTGAR